MSTAVEVATKKFLERPDQAARREALIEACLEAGEPGALFRAAAEALEGGGVEEDQLGAVGGWLVEAATRAVEQEEGHAAARVLLRASSVARQLLKRPDEAGRLAEKAHGLDPGIETARGALATMDEETPAEERLTWIDRVYEGSEDQDEKVATAVKGVDTARGADLLGEALYWAEQAAGIDEGQQGVVDGLVKEIKDRLQSLEQNEVETRKQASRKDRAHGLATIAKSMATMVPDYPRARELAREALELRPEDPEIIELVASQLEMTGELEGVATMFQRLLERTERRSLRLLAHRRLADLYRSKLEKPELAEEHLRKVLDIEPSDKEAFDTIAAVLQENGEHEALVELYEAAVRQHPPKPRAVEMLSDMGRILWRRLEDLDRAEDAYRRLRSLDPKNLDAVSFFEHLHEKNEDWRRLYATLSQRLSLETEDRARSEVARRMAKIAEEHLDDNERALESWKRALRFDPDDDDTQKAISRLYQQTGKWHALVDFLNAQIQSVSDGDVDRRVALLFRLIEIYQDPSRLPSEDMVVKTYRRIVELSPTNVEALDSLAERYEDKKRWRDLVNVLQKRVEVTEDVDELLRLFHQIADLWMKRMANPSQAIPFLEKVLELDPDNLGVVRNLREIYRAKHNIEKLYAAYERELELEKDKAARKKILVELATLAQSRLHEPGRSMGYWEQVLDLDPEHAHALSALWNLYTQNERWDSMLGLVDRLLDRGDLSRKRRVELLERKGRILSEQLSDTDAAREVFAEILRTAPGNSFATGALQELYVRTRDWPSLSELFAEREDWFGYIHLLEDHERKSGDADLKADIHREVSRVYAEHLGDMPKAGERMARVLELRSDDLEAVRWLLEHADEAGRLDERASLIDRLLEHSTDTHERGRMLALATELAVERGDSGAALGYASDRLALEAAEYGSPVPLEPLVDLALSNHAACPQLVDALERAAPNLGDDKDRRVYARVGARLVADTYPDPEDAIGRWQQILADEPDDAEALEVLERLLRGARRWEDLEEVLRAKARQADGGAKIGLLRQLATLYEDVLDNAPAALDVMREAEALDPSDDELSSAVRRILRSEERFEELASLLQGDAERAEGATRNRILMELIDLFAGPLLRTGDALALIEQQLGEAPEYEERLVEHLVSLMDDPEVGLQAARRLRVVREAAGNAGALAAVLERLSGMEPEAEERLTAALSLSEVWEVRLGEPPRAFEIVKALVEEHGPREDLLNRITALAGVADMRAELTDQLRDLTEQPQHDPAVLADLRRRLANELRASDDGLPEAAEVLQALLYEDPDDTTAADDLEQVLTQLKDSEALVAFYRSRADVVFESEDKVRLHLTICRLLREELERPEEAIDHYRSVLLLDEAHPEAMDALEELYRAHGYWEELVALLQRRLTLATEPKDRSALHLEIGVISKDRLEDVPQSIDELASALEEDSSNTAAVEALEQLLRMGDLPDHDAVVGRVIEILMPLFREAGTWDKVVYLLALDAELEADPIGRATRYAEIGRIWEERLNDREMALQAYLRSVELDPSKDDTHELARTAGLEVGKAAEYAELVERLLESGSYDSPAVRHLEVAGLFDRHLEKPDSARAHYEAALEIEPHHPDALRALDRLYELDGRDEDRVEVLDQLSRVAADDEQRADVHWRLAQLAERVEEPERAILSLQWIVDHPDSAAAERVRACLVDLARLHNEAGAAGDERDALDLLIEATEVDNERADLLARAVAASEAAGDLAGAVERARKRVAIDPTRTEPWEELERLLDQSGDLEALAGALREEIVALPDPGARDAAVLRLVDLLRGPAGKPEEVGDVVAAALARGEPSPERVSELEEGVDDPTVAVAVGVPLADFLELADQPEREAVLREHLLGEHAERVDVGALHKRLLDLYRGPVPDETAAVRHAVALVALDPDDEVMVEALAGVLDGTPALLEVAEETLEEAMASAPPARRAASRRLLAGHARGADDLARAAGLLQRVVEEDPSDRAALHELEEVLEQEEDWPFLAEVLRKHADVAEEVEERREVRMRLASVLRIGTDDLAGAEDTLRAVLAEDPADGEAFEELADVLRESESHEGLAALLVQRLEICPDVDAVPLRIQLIGVLSSDLADAEAAQGQASELLARSADDPAVRGCVMDLFTAMPDVRVPLAGALTEAYLEASELREADQVLSLAVEQEQDEDTKVSSLRQQIALRRDHMGDPVSALESAYTLARVLPTADEAAQVLAIAEQVGGMKPSEALWLLEKLATEEPMADEQRAQLAALVADESAKLSDLERAVRLYRLASEAAPDDREVADRMLELCRREGLHKERVELLKELAERDSSPDVALPFLREAAEVLSGDLEDPAGAVEVLRLILDLSPTDREALLGVEELLKGQEAWEDLLPHYEQWLTVIGDPEETVDVRWRLADVMVSKLGRHDDAMDHLEGILLDKPEHEGALDVLTGWLKDAPSGVGAELLARAVDTLEFQARYGSTPERKSLLLRARADLAEEPEDKAELLESLADTLSACDEQAAYRAADEGLEHDPSRPGLVEIAAALAELTGNASELTLKLRSIERQRPELFESAVHLRTLAGLLWSLDDKAEAAELYERLVEISPDEPKAYECLEAYLRDAGDPARLASFLQGRVDMVDEAGDRAKILQELAGLRRDDLDEPEAARDALVQAREADPTDRDIFEELEGIHEALEEHQSLEALYRAELDRVDAGEDEEWHVDLLVRLASALERGLDRPEEAAVAYEEALKLRKHNLYALMALERIYGGLLRWHDLVRVLQTKLEVLHSERDRVQVHLQIGQVLWERIGEPDEAVQHFRLVLERDDSNSEAVAGLERILADGGPVMQVAFVLEPVYEASGDKEALATLLQRELEELAEVQARVDVRLRLGEILADMPGRMDESMAQMAKAASGAEDPEHVVDRLVEVAREHSALEAVPAALKEAGEAATEPAARNLMLRRAAALLAEELDDPAGAAAVLDELRLERPGDLDLLERLVEIHRRLERPDGLHEALRAMEAALTAEGAERRVDVMVERAKILHESLDNAVEAAELLREVIWVDPDKTEAVDLLEKVAAAPEAYSTARDVLEPVLKEGGEARRLVTLYMLGAELDEPPEVRAELLVRAGDALVERLEAPDEAFERYLQSLEVHPYQEDLLGKVLRMTEGEERAAKARPVLEGLLDAALPSDQEVQVRAGLATFAEEGGDDGAIEAQLRAIVDLQPDRIEILDRLIALLARQERHAEVLELSERKLELPLTAEERVDLLHTMAKAAGEQGDDDAAHRHLDALLEIAPRDVGALAGMEEILRRRDDAAGLVEVLEQRAELVDEAESYADLKAEIAQLREGRLNDLTGAVPDLEDALDRAPGRVDLADRLEGLYLELGQSQSLYRFYGKQAEVCKDEARKARLLKELGMLAFKSLAQPETAARYLRQAVDLAPEDVEARATLEELYEEAGQYFELVELHRKRLETASTDAEKAVALMAVIRARMAHGESGKVLRGDLERLLQIDPGSGSVAQLKGDLLSAEDKPGDAYEAYTNALEMDVAPEERLELHRKLGRLCAGPFGRRSEAQKHFNAVLSEEPLDEEAGRALEGLYEETGSHEALAALLSRRLTHVNERGERVRLLARIAAIHLDKLDDAVTFLDWIGRARELKADDPAVVELLIRYHERTGDLSELIPLLSWYVNYLEARRDFREAGQHAHRLARYHIERDAWDEAGVYARMATRYDPENHEPMLSYAAILEHDGEWDLARNVYQSILMLEGRLDDVSVRADVFFRMARVCHELKDTGRTRQYLERCLMIDPDHEAAQRLAESLK